ncbi:MAG: hypothetical protein HOE53_00780 [Candidatus Magasanikbacteria bacterium]|jgi:hypothetical protein|nr:hypothetical protein [Candidatus Magasanikbacteria bacterium]
MNRGKLVTIFSLALALPVFIGLSVAGVALAATVDVTATVPALCGNGVKEGAEACDGGDIGTTCGLQGFDAGAISCSGTCTLDVSACTNDDGGAGAMVPPPVVNPPAPDPEPEPEPEPIDPPVEPEPEPEPVDPPAEPEPIDPPDPDPDDPPAPDPDPADPPIEPAPDNGNNNAPPAIIPVPAQPPVALPPVNNVVGNAGGGLAPIDENLVQGFAFWVGNRTFSVAPHQGRLTSLAGDTISIASRVGADPAETILAIRMVIGQDIIVFKKGNDGSWYTDVKMPAPGSYRTVIETTHKSGKVEQFELIFVSASYGRVTQSGSGDPIASANVQLLDSNAGGLWDGGPFGQANPMAASESGYYGYLVPNGTYQLIVEHEGYKRRETLTFEVRDHVINNNLKLIVEAAELAEVLDIFNSDASASEKIAASVNVITGATKETLLEAAETITDVARKIDDAADNPQVEEVTQEVVAPALVTVATAAVVPSLWGTALPLLRYIFLQPFLLLGRRKRKEWGVVYNSLTKLPIDLATIRLIDEATGKIKQSRVTDAGGRYLFVVEPGAYKIEVMKQGFTFPTSVLQGISADGEFLDIYHGEGIKATAEKIGLTPNIPVDPAGKHKTPRRIVRDKFLRALQHTISVAGVILSGVALYITPTLTTKIILGVNVALYLIFMRFVKPPKPSGWGLVSERGGKELKNAVVRLFTKEYNKLVSTQVTDAKGRYAFLVGPNDYYVKVSKPGYQEFKSDDIAVKGKKASSKVLKENIEVDKEDNK